MSSAKSFVEPLDRLKRDSNLETEMTELDKVLPVIVRSMFVKLM